MAYPAARAREVDLVIVGAGPAGLFAAYYGGFRGLGVAVVDSLPQPGGQVMAMYPEKPIYDIAGFPSVRGRDLIDGLMRQAAPFEPLYLLGQQATELHRSDDGSLTLATSAGERVTCRAVILTAGVGTFTPRRLPAGNSYEDRGLMYFVPRPQDLADQDVVIVGGGDSAVDWALLLDGVARSVTLVHRRARFRAHEHSVAQMMASPSIEVLTDHEIVEAGGTHTLEHVRVANKRGNERSLKCQSLVAALGFVADLGPLAEWGVELRDRHILVDTTMATNLPGVFAAGDVTEYPGKVRLIAVGFGEAATAVNNAMTLINPEASLFPGHSTDQPC
ncbi:NAD(P)/FAD-dependent oxidoreductase [Streptomyces cylindrosporus]|uniref:Ferredoxin--NADP reductase n=1 Tax=Streptomyces cylindrosporus TaxID=2927583 RepID=A0ABS9Y8U9_9ACTN|nr:NAD(P)/FAD-dependent oxidoreductase [Streptomyces cylindrosporus]MCI3273389.1 NAD(P)/FAD-dependent oxidoreductase [Streptomyces cylindrosporus]